MQLSHRSFSAVDARVKARRSRWFAWTGAADALPPTMTIRTLSPASLSGPPVAFHAHDGRVLHCKNGLPKRGRTLTDPHADRLAPGGLPNHLLKARENALPSL